MWLELLVTLVISDWFWLTPACTPAPVASCQDLKNENSRLPREEMPSGSQALEDMSPDIGCLFDCFPNFSLAISCCF